MNTAAWTDDKQHRLDDLRAREDSGTLTPAEQAELTQLLADLDEMEWQQLRPALERMDREHAAASAAINRLVQTQDDLDDLMNRQRRLIVRARSQLQELLSEHRVLQADYRRLNIDVQSA